MQTSPQGRTLGHRAPRQDRSSKDVAQKRLQCTECNCLKYNRNVRAADPQAPRERVFSPSEALLKNASRTRTRCHAHAELSRKPPSSVDITSLVTPKNTDALLKATDFHYVRFRSPKEPSFDSAEIEEKLQSRSIRVDIHGSAL